MSWEAYGAAEGCLRGVSGGVVVSKDMSDGNVQFPRGSGGGEAMVVGVQGLRRASHVLLNKRLTLAAQRNGETSNEVA